MEEGRLGKVRICRARLGFDMGDLSLGCSVGCIHKVKPWRQERCQFFWEALQEVEYPDHLFVERGGFASFQCCVVVFWAEVFPI